MRIAIIAHVFYAPLWDELKRHIQNYSAYQPDIFISTSESSPSSLDGTIRQDLPSASVTRLPNRGFDVGPFVKLISLIDLDKYDFIVKIHTKRNRFGIVNFMPLFGGQWRRKLLSFCDSPGTVRETLNDFSRDASIGMIGCGTLIVRPWDELTATPGVAATGDRRAFIGGTMFIARALLFKQVIAAVSFDNFSLTDRRCLQTLAHEWERRIGYSVSEQGLRISPCKPIGWLFSHTFKIRKRSYYFIRRLVRPKHCWLRRS